jgi:SSS family solute:Na+ symporter
MLAHVLHPVLESRDMALPTLLMHNVPPLIGSLGLAALFSAEISSADAILFMLSTSLAEDIYRRFVRPDATDGEVLRMARIAAVAGGTAGIGLAIVLPSVIGSLSIFYTLLSVSLFVPVVVGLYTRGPGTAAALAAMTGGVAGVLVVRSGIVPDAALVTPYTMGLVAAAVGYALGAALGRGRRRAA